jgi:hypothetical protein
MLSLTRSVAVSYLGLTGRLALGCTQETLESL